MDKCSMKNGLMLDGVQRHAFCDHFHSLSTRLSPCSNFGHCLFSFACIYVPSVLWRCWLGDRKGIWPVKNWVVGRGVLAWLSVCSKVQTCIWPSWCHCHSLSLASVKSRLVSPLWSRLTQVVPEKWPLNARVCVLYMCFVSLSYLFICVSAVYRWIFRAVECTWRRRRRQSGGSRQQHVEWTPHVGRQRQQLQQQRRHDHHWRQWCWQEEETQELGALFSR